MLCSIRWLILLSIPSMTMAQNQDSLTRFLEDVAKKSHGIKLSEAQRQQRIAANESLRSPLEGSGDVGVLYQTARPTPGANFSLDSSQSTSLSSRYSKLWSNGWRTGLSYTLTQSHVDAGTRGSIHSYVPDLALTASTSIFQDLMADRYRYLEKKLKQTRDVIDVESRLAKKQQLVQALLLLASILEIEDEMILQQRICREVSRQTRLLKMKDQRGTVNRRDYLLSQKELIGCKSLIKSLEKNSFSLKEELFQKHAVRFEGRNEFDINRFYNDIKAVYKVYDGRDRQVKIEEQESLQALYKRKRLGEIELAELEAQNRPDLTFSIGVGVQGYNEEFGASHESFAKGDHPYAEAGLTYTFPVEKLANRSQLIAKRYSQEALDHEIEIEKASRAGRLRVLSQTLDRDFSIFEDRKKSVNLSKQILKDAEKDFQIGRLDFNTLTEFQKGLLESQRGLADIRSQIVVNTIEFVDFFQFFDRFY
ncbi:TolC family protein [Pseudobacteriovorax antillogorgiicola]|uniref:Outer membrane protein TolC n=1 Tax=Pseudobacteriovorax antillogorgiicola TaxID=1513793 RepID=A0A1Y6C4A8_9BACT|nr:TolC family protein [Pseudobacteriovorax antillogorgiicola]TCS49825.1 hypothetical protein EDD56_11470 [Pseudobacteriovorax antillogorgiicola]SMF43314.1 hypothetical protein SAMN06296036_11369 [Pseudobacteriovorax antillogorgiicola]